MKYTITKNEQYKSIEVAFDGKPDTATRDALKGLKFRWHGVKKVWYGYTTEADLIAVLNGEKKPQAKATTDAPVNWLGVKVGDIFRTCWGYDQTTNDFYQVAEIVGKKMVRIVPVAIPYEGHAVSSMSEDRHMTITPGKMYPTTRDIFVPETGSTKMVQNCGTPDNPVPYIRIDTHMATPFTGGTVYESWYA